MAKILTTKSIYYNDVNLIAQSARIESRKDVPLELDRIIVSPMSAVVGQTFAIEATKLGLSVCQHKFCDIDNAVLNYSIVPNKKNLFVSIGLNDWERARELAEEGATNWLIDCANGYLPQIRGVINKLIGKHKVNRLMVGNVMTADGIHLYEYFSKYIPEIIIRVGIAGGSACAPSGRDPARSRPSRSGRALPGSVRGCRRGWHCWRAAPRRRRAPRRHDAGRTHHILRREQVRRRRPRPPRRTTL